MRACLRAVLLALLALALAGSTGSLAPALFLFSPLLNAAVRALSRRQLKAVVLCLLAFFCFGKSLSVLPFGTDRYGYDFGWFCCLYLIAAYLRSYGSTFLYGKKRGGALYLISCAGVAFIAFSPSRISRR